jgi:hypothetical protein
VAVWTITRGLAVTYEDSRGMQDCGKATCPQAKLDDIVAWATQNASPGDFIISPDGVFVRQAEAKA